MCSDFQKKYRCLKRKKIFLIVSHRNNCLELGFYFSRLLSRQIVYVYVFNAKMGIVGWIRRMLSSPQKKIVLLLIR